MVAKKIAIAIVSNRQIKPKTVRCLMELCATTGHEIFPIVATEGYTTAEGRNYATIQAIRNQCDYLLFIDDDMTFDADILDRLLAHRKEIVGVYSYSRTLPLSPTVAFLDENNEYKPQDRMAFVKRPEELFKCYTIGMGVALINLKVFQKIDKPWFAFEAHESGKIMTGEDAWFCRQAREKGISVWCDPTVSVGHIGDFNYGEDEEKDYENVIYD